MNTGDVIFCSMIFQEKFWKLSDILIESWLKYTGNSKFIILTDNVEYYNKYSNLKNIIAKEVPLDHKAFEYNASPLHNRGFLANIEHLAVQYAMDHVEHEKHICYLDADCWITNELDNKHFETLKPGLNAPLGLFDNYITLDNLEECRNPIVADKIKFLAKHFNQSINIDGFREVCLLYSDIHNLTFKKFLNIWKQIYFLINENNFSHEDLCLDIHMAAQIAKMPINNILINENCKILINNVMTICYNGAIRRAIM